MSVHEVYYKDKAKYMRPVLTREQYLALRDSAEQRNLLKKVRKGNKTLKSKLLQMNYSCLPNEDGTLRGSKRMSSTVGMDIDFTPPKDLTPEEQEKWLAENMAKVPEMVMEKKEELGLLMLERSVTKGYHLVFRRREDLSQEDNLKWASELLGIKFDEGAKDITRVFFTTTAEELLYLDDEIFTISEVEGQRSKAEGQESKAEGEEAKVEGSPQISEVTERTRFICERVLKDTGLKRKSFVSEGARHNSVKIFLTTANQLLEKDEMNGVLAELMPEHWNDENIQVLVEDFYSKYHDQNKPLNQIQKAIFVASQKYEENADENKPQEAKESTPQTIDKERNADVYDPIELEKFAVQLQEMAKYYPCMKELFVNLHPNKMPAVFFASAALFGTLMTRSWYHFWYEPELMRRLNYSIFIIGDPGAGKNVIEKFYHKLAAPMREADDALIEQVNKYKDGRTERTTSTKAQKGDALKKPVVPIRVHPARTANGEFIRHMMAAVQIVQGIKINLHMFSFDSELDNVTKNSKGGDYKDKEVLELKAFHNEQDGQMYANTESVTGMFNIYWNFIYTGTPYALHRKVNQRNFGTGLSTRLAVIPMPDKGLALRKQKVDEKANETLKMWAYRLDKVEGEIPIEALNDETYEWQSSHMEIAEFNGDKADRTLLKRIPYYGIGISLPFILMRHWKEWEDKHTLTMDDRDKALCRLAMEIQYKCQQFFFGEMAHNYFEDQNKEFIVRRRTTRYDECYSKLPEQFNTKKFMEVFGCSTSAASRAILRLQADQIIKRVKYGTYKKTAHSLP